MKRLTPRRGFTLIEIILALGVLALLAGTLARTMQATITSTAVLRDTQHSRQQILGFFQLCQKTFGSLNSSASLIWTLPTGAHGSLPEIDLRHAPDAFTWGSQSSFYGETALCLHPTGDGTLTLGIEQRQLDPQTNAVLPNPLWLPLVGNLRSVVWSFYDTRTSQWQDTWLDTSRHPTLMNVTLEVSGQSHTWTQTIYFPPLAASPNGGGSDFPN